MFGFGSYFSFGIFGLLLMVTAVIHYVRKQPNWWWLWVILLLGPIGALIYLAMEAAPELGDPGTFKFVQRGRRIRELEVAIRDNPSAGNFEELGQLYLDEGRWQAARTCFDRSISQRTDSVDPFYRRAVAEVELGDYEAARGDLERVVAKDKGYDFHRAGGLLAYAYAKTKRPEQANAMFQESLRISTLTETQLHYAQFLAEQGRKAEAKEWAQRILQKRATMPGFLRRRERPLFRRTNALLRGLPR